MKSFLLEFWWFGLKQAYACLFAGMLLFLIVLTKFLWPDDFIIARYDFLFAAALLAQAAFMALKLETKDEVIVIFSFHIVGTAMEIFKTHMGSWIYPEANILRIGGVPLFSGFMYAAIGSYIARIWRIFDMRFTFYPSRKLTIILCALIYANFFTHHYVYDLRYLLFAMTFALYGRTTVYFKPNGEYRHMPLLVGFGLVALFIWLAENLGTFSAAWHYPNQIHAWQLVSLSKIGSWYLLMIISFVLVSLVHPPEERGT